MDDISKALAYQVKREMAEQYFSARKAIEEDIDALQPMYQELRDFYELRIAVDLLRIYSMLKDRELIKDFMSAVHWDGLPFYDDYMVASKNIAKRLREPVTAWGITAFYRFFNELCNAYELLERDVSRYHAMLEDLEEEVSVINEEITLFERRFSWDDMMSFLKNIEQDAAMEGVLGQNLMAAPDLRGKGLRLSKVSNPKDSLPFVPHIPPLNDIRSVLKDMAKKAYVM